MIGQAKGIMTPVIELEAGDMVTVDHEVFEVLEVVFISADRARVELVSEYRSDWTMWVNRSDYDACLFEVV